MIAKQYGFSLANRLWQLRAPIYNALRLPAFVNSSAVWRLPFWPIDRPGDWGLLLTRPADFLYVSLVDTQWLERLMTRQHSRPLERRRAPIHLDEGDHNWDWDREYGLFMGKWQPDPYSYISTYLIKRLAQRVEGRTVSNGTIWGTLSESIDFEIEGDIQELRL